MRPGDSMPLILLIDDEQSLAYLIDRYGRASNCRVIKVQLLDEAMAVIERSWPDLVMLHIAPSRPGGWEIVRALKADPATSALPVAVCTTGTDAARLRELGADYCLAKPIMYDDFRAVLIAVGVIRPTSLL